MRDNMVRVNIHLKPETTAALDALVEKLDTRSIWRQISRADLIRYAIKKTFDINTGYTGTVEDRLKNLEEIERTKKNEKRKTKRV